METGHCRRKDVSPSEFTVKEFFDSYMFSFYLTADTPLCAQSSQLFKQDLTFNCCIRKDKIALFAILKMICLHRR